MTRYRARQLGKAFVAVAAVVLRDIGNALVDAADAIDAATGVETTDRCPTFVPDYLLVDR